MTLLLPCRFEAWDLDKDGYINVEEFAFAGHATTESRSTRELFKKIDSDSKHERFKHFLILFWKRIHSKELCLHLLKFICRQKLPRRKRLCLWSHCSLLCQTVKFALHELVKRILF